MNQSAPVAAFAPAAGYTAAELRPALEAVLAPQLDARGPLHGKSVLLKPNLLTWRKQNDPACVHPAFLLETAKLFLDAGAAKVAVLENPAIQSTPSILHAMGIDSELKKCGVAFAGFQNFHRLDRPPEGMRFHDLEIAAEYLDFDFTADLAKVKTHGMMTLTLCVKNLFGLVNGSARLGWHLSVGRNFALFADMLLDLYLAIHPAFNLLDGIIAMEGNGPGSGTPVPRHFVAGGTDALSLDAATAPRLGVPDLLLIRRGQERGLLSMPEIIAGKDLAIEPLHLPDPPAPSLEWGVALPPFCRDFLRDHLLSKPVLDPEKCIGCGLCVRMCPPKSLKLVNQKPVFRYPECIRCYCCQEHCPQSAITPRRSWSMKLLEHAERAVRGCFRRK